LIDACKIRVDRPSGRPGGMISGSVRGSWLGGLGRSIIA
jgi:hypothetical protein